MWKSNKEMTAKMGKMPCGLHTIPVAPTFYNPKHWDSYFKADLQQAYSPSALESQDTKDNFKIEQTDKHWSGM